MRAIPRGGLGSWKGGWRREDEGRRERAGGRSALEQGLPCLLCSLAQKSSLPLPVCLPFHLPFHSVPPFSTSIVTMANLWGRSRWREFFSGVEWSGGRGRRLLHLSSLRPSMKIGKNAPRTMAILPDRPTSPRSQSLPSGYLKLRSTTPRAPRPLRGVKPACLWTYAHMNM